MLCCSPSCSRVSRSQGRGPLRGAAPERGFRWRSLQQSSGAVLLRAAVVGSGDASGAVGHAWPRQPQPAGVPRAVPTAAGVVQMTEGQEETWSSDANCYVVDEDVDAFGARSSCEMLLAELKVRVPHRTFRLVCLCFHTCT